MYWTLELTPRPKKINYYYVVMDGLFSSSGNTSPKTKVKNAKVEKNHKRTIFVGVETPKQVKEDVHRMSM